MKNYEGWIRGGEKVAGINLLIGYNKESKVMDLLYLDLLCPVCGAGLEGRQDLKKTTHSIIVSPCGECFDLKKDKAKMAS